MRLLLRWFFNGLCLLSLLLWAALLFGWACAQFGDRVWLRFVRHSLMVYGAEGDEVVSAERYFFDPNPTANNAYEGPADLLRLLRKGAIDVRSSRFAGIEFYNDADHPAPRFRVLVVPMAYPLLLAAVLPVLWAARADRKRRRRARGRCVACGYDLRATPEAGGALLERCPECGAEGAEGAEGAVPSRKGAIA